MTSTETIRAYIANNNQKFRSDLLREAARKDAGFGFVIRLSEENIRHDRYACLQLVPWPFVRPDASINPWRKHFAVDKSLVVFPHDFCTEDHPVLHELRVRPSKV